MSGYELRGNLMAAAPAWHVTPEGDTLALCGKLLPPDAEVRAIAHLGLVPDEWRCDGCWSAYLGTLESDVTDGVLGG